MHIDVTDAAYSSRLRALAYKAKTIVEETGANNLYLAFGMLRWEFNGRELSSPLVLVPVTLEGSARGQTFRLHLDEAGESTPNYCLLEKLRITFGLEIPGLANPAKDDSGIDLPAAFAATRRALTDARLPFTVDDTVDLSILQFAKYRLWRDLDENWESFASNPLVAHLIHTPTAVFEDPVAAPAEVDLDGLSTAVPVPADSSQLDAVAEAVAGRTFVLEGPPGTGKSQTITNLLAHSLANGKRVLFVAEKRAALDVVKRRLDEVGLGPFSLDLHDKGARPTAVRAQIKTAMDASARPDGAALHAETEVAAASRSALRRYAERLHEPNSAGLSLYSARSRLLATLEDVPALPVSGSYVATADLEGLAQIRSVLRGLPETADLAHPSASHPWRFIEKVGPIDVSVADRAARDFDAALAAVEAIPAARSLIDRAISPEAIVEAADIADSPRFPLEAIDAFGRLVRSGEIKTRREQVEKLAAHVPPWTQIVAPDVLTSDVRAINAHAVAADASGFFGRRKRRRAVLSEYGTDLRIDAKKFDPKAVTPLTADIVMSLASLEIVRYPLTSLPLPVAPSDWNPWTGGGAAPVLEQIDWGRWLSEALESSTNPWREELRSFYASTEDDDAQSVALSRLAATWQGLLDALPEVDADAMSRWSGEAGFLRRWIQTRGARNLVVLTPVVLQRWTDFARALEPLIRLSLREAHQELLDGVIPADLASLAFDKGVAAASIIERQESQALASFDVAAHNRTIERFTSSAGKIRAELPRWIPAEILAKRTVDPAYDGGSMGELKRQLSRQRGGMSVRSLFEHYGSLITQLAPCVLMSPESVARFFPATARLFDVVVFDEASQIRVADAVGAMGRGHSVVVVGDSKQMPPTSFAEVSVDVDAEGGTAPEALADEESILTECVQARVASKWLSWHYRSQDEALISFSNHSYYESRLSSFPAPWRSSTVLSDDDHGLSLVRVSGHFNRSGKGRDLRTNAVEAGAIVEEIARRFTASPHVTPSLGVITFNAQQRTLIETLLREHSDERLATALDERDGLFIKNLENVQGDERDVILFSVAFSANERGYVPLNFGPLSRAGGERRLNVAITRARRQVILFASFDPAELRAEQTASVGIKHLKAYLELAATGVESETDNPLRQAVIDRHRDQIASELRDRGFAVRTDVGLSDFRVDLAVASPDDPSQPVVAVLLDGEGWRARRTVADRDGLPVDVLQGLMRWPSVERIWLPEWLHQPEATLDRIAAAVDHGLKALRQRAVQRETARASRAAEPPAENEAPDTASLPTRSAAAAQGAEAALSHPGLREFVEWRPRRAGSTVVLDSLPSPRAAESVRAVIRDVVRTEGPVHKMRLAKLVAESFGLSRVAAARTDAILRCVPSELLAAHDRSCVWPEDIDPLTWHVARRSQPGDGRLLEHVPLEEVANAMAIVAQLGGGMSESELKREALELFGGKRMTDGISERLDLAIARGVESGRITQDPSGLWRS